jgi:tRNA pseudouridine55 synthase
MTAPDGILVVDKPADWTSHDVVARCRRLAATRRVGHAGTLDPMATGVLVIGIGRATRLLGYLALTTKSYEATVRLGQTTLTDDAQGEILASIDAAGVEDDAIHRGVAALTGDLMQIPSAVSAIKVKGKRAYTRVRDGEEVELAARPVTVHAFAVRGLRRHGPIVDVDVEVECSSGTYVRALARDLGVGLGVGGHLTSLRRTRVGDYGIDQAHTVEDLAGTSPEVLPVQRLDQVAQRAFAWYVVPEEQVSSVRNGRAIRVRLRAVDEGDDWTTPDSETVATGEFRPGERGKGPAGPVAVLAPGGAFLGLYEQHGPVAQAVAVFAPA